MKNPKRKLLLSPGGSASGQLLSRSNGLRGCHGNRVPAAAGAHVLKREHLKKKIIEIQQKL
jgi:hypothetical protein